MKVLFGICMVGFLLGCKAKITISDKSFYEKVASIVDPMLKRLQNDNIAMDKIGIANLTKEQFSIYQGNLDKYVLLVELEMAANHSEFNR